MVCAAHTGSEIVLARVFKGSVNDVRGTSQVFKFAHPHHSVLGRFPTTAGPTDVVIVFEERRVFPAYIIKLA